MPTRTRLQMTGPCLTFVTTTVTDWVPVFGDKRLAECVLTTFGEGLTRQKVSCIAYVLMPSHLHAVIGVTDYSLISRFMQSFKIISSKNLKEQLGHNFLERITNSGKYHFWQPRYDELVITSEKQFRTKIQYIHTNPVRAGLVREAVDWVYSSARSWNGKGRGIVPIDTTFSFER